MSKIICSWCNQEIEIKIIRDKDGNRCPINCPKCFKDIPSSKIEYFGNIQGKKHYHEDY